MASTVSSTDTSKDDQKKTKIRKLPSKVTKKGSKRCYMHLSSVQGEDVQEFTWTRWKTYRTCLRQWLSLQGASKDLAENYKHCVDIDFDSVPEDAGFHRTCYTRFICKRRLSLAEKKLQTVPSEQSVPSDRMADAETSAETPRKLHCRAGLPIPSVGPVLPPLCIICKKAEKIITVKGKRQRDKLSQAETSTAGRLQTAAELREDTSVLLHIREKDCVALEVRYHRTCYTQYTKFLSRAMETNRPTATPDEITETLFTDSYNVFCETVVRQRIIVDQEVLRMDKLRKTFMDIVKNQEGLDASEYRQDLLKRRLKRDFPQLIFHCPAKRSISELVFVETLSADRLLQKIPPQSGTSTELFASGIFCKNSPQDDDLFGFTVEDVLNEVKRGKRLRCNRCKTSRATAGCDVGRCKKTYHYPCAVESGAACVENNTEGTYVLYCPMHDPSKQGHDAVAGPSNHNAPPRSKNGIVEDSSESDEGERAENSDHCAPLDSDIEDISDEQQNPQPPPARNGLAMDVVSNSGTLPMQPEAGDNDETIMYTDSESLLPGVSTFGGVNSGSQLVQDQAMSTASAPQSSNSPASFWESGDKVGCTSSIFSDFIAEMNSLFNRIQSGQASQEDYSIALNVMKASGKLPDLMAKQEKEIKKKKEDMQKFRSWLGQPPGNKNE